MSMKFRPAISKGLWCGAAGVLASILLTTTVLAGDARPVDPSVFSQLVPRKTFRFQVLPGGYSNGGRVEITDRGALPLGVPDPLTLLNAGVCFENIGTAAKALELCQLLHWGALVEDPEILLKLWRVGHAAEHEARGDADGVRKEEADFQAAVKGMTFDVVSRKAEKGFEVAFTAFVMGHGQGSRCGVSRFRYLVTPEGTITLQGVDRYLEGPSLNWQREIGSWASREESEKELGEEKLRTAGRDAFLKLAYELCPKRIPERLNTGLKP